MAHPPTRPGGPHRPTRLGQWEVIAKIAGGGMSAVYLGRRVEPAPDILPHVSGGPLRGTTDVVALKIARHELRMDERMLSMFLEEGKLIARLVHPNIVRTLEVGGDAELDFIAMELMLGKTFAAIYDAITLREVRLNPEIVAWTAARIADALHYAHELTDESGRPLGLVHRDVNPANVFATFKGEVKLFDFGLAKVTTNDAAGTHILAGKLSYLSPEQIMQMPVDRRSDIFSLGTTFWELLTGRRLFRRDSDLDTVRAVQLGPIPDPRSIAPDVPEELARIARTALERNREHRYPNAARLARELDAFVFRRSSAAEVTARLAQLVDTLFPGEQKRQSGWLKPAISGSRTMTAVTPGSVIPSAPSSASSLGGPLSSSRPSPPTPSPPRETTEVMANAPLRGLRSAPPFADTARDLPSPPFDVPKAEVSPGPITPRDAFGSYAEVITDEVTIVPPHTEREAPTFEMTPTEGVPPPPASSTATGLGLTTPSSSPLPPGPVSNRPWPKPPPNRAAPIAAPPPIPQRTRVPVGGQLPATPPAFAPVPSPTPSPKPIAPSSRAPGPASKGPPPLPAIRNDDDDLSKTEVQYTPPFAPASAKDGKPSEKASFPPPRPKRAPVPLPSRSVPPKPPPTTSRRAGTPTEPPPNDTKIDRQGGGPPRKR